MTKKRKCQSPKVKQAVGEVAVPPAGMRSERVPSSFSTRQGSLPETIAEPPVRSQAAVPFSNVPPPMSE